MASCCIEINSACITQLAFSSAEAPKVSTFQTKFLIIKRKENVSKIYNKGDNKIHIFTSLSQGDFVLTH